MSLYLCPLVDDSIIWDASSNGSYTTKTAYHWLNSHAHVSLGGSASNKSWM